MKRNLVSTVASALILGLAAVACTESGTAPSPEVAGDELEAFLLETVGIAADQANGSSVVPSSARSDVSSTPAAAHGDCTYSSGTARFTCPDVTRRGVTISRSYALFDAAGNAQERRDSNTVTVNTQVWARGTVVRDSSSATIDRRSDLTSTGVQRGSPSRTLNGTEHGSMTVKTRTARGTVVSTGTFGDTTAGLVIPQGDSSRKWPLAGTVIRSHSGTRALEGGSHSRSFSHRAVFVYDGSSAVKVTVTTNGNTRSCIRNMETRTQQCTP